MLLSNENMVLIHGQSRSHGQTPYSGHAKLSWLLLKHGMKAQYYYLTYVSNTFIHVGIEDNHSQCRGITQRHDDWCSNVHLDY